jgi:hypothetical protein
MASWDEQMKRDLFEVAPTDDNAAERPEPSVKPNAHPSGTNSYRILAQRPYDATCIQARMVSISTYQVPSARNTYSL